ncbi:MAG: LuxR C-terminal-related transcriptional regulator [Marinifilum sp.]|jgi:DNA-binding CsgD family transcriptional regulator|nr:LuxR C-terminal-related transcriptional regulator [Marinifilum sp.]
MREPKLPSCLEKEHVEFFRYEGKLRAVYNGWTCSYYELPIVIRAPFEKEFMNDTKAQDCLRNDMYVTSKVLEKFIACRYGNFDNTPDLVNGKPEADAPNCHKEETCPGFGKVCLIPGGLTPQQYFITRLISLGKQDKEIADELEIALPTVRTHYTRIRETLKVNNRNEIALWAHKKGIV